MDLRQEVYLPIIQWHPFFFEYSDLNSAAARSVCHKAVQEVLLTENERLFSLGQAADRMFLVVDGVLAYFLGGEDVGSTLPSRAPQASPSPVFSEQWISEAALWLHWFHPGDMTSKERTFMLAVLVKPM